MNVLLLELVADLQGVVLMSWKLSFQEDECKPTGRDRRGGAEQERRKPEAE